MDARTDNIRIKIMKITIRLKFGYKKPENWLLTTINNYDMVVLTQKVINNQKEVLNMLSILDYPSKELLGFKELEWTYHQMAKVAGRDETLFAAVYGAYLCSVNELHSVEALDEYLEKSVSERRCLFVKSMLSGDLSLPVEMNETGKFTKKTYENYFRYCSLLDSGIKSEFGTPLSVSVLAACALDIHAGEKIADFGSGVGDFLCYASEGCKEASYYGVD
ncbi:MAG: hypothetical protein K6E75_13205, partial [Lachnospiraceae bacterium]|nr:hypothetical protein [Lachnospiraceae bacterium]